MNPKDIQLKKEVLQRVTSVYHMRTFVRPLIVKCVLFFVSLGLINLLVSVPHILANMSRISTSGVFAYVFRAFLHTNIAVQGVLVIALVFFVLLANDTVRNIRFIVMRRNSHSETV